jgi:hypothetical protein
VSGRRCLYFVRIEDLAAAVALREAMGRIVYARPAGRRRGPS